MPTNLEVIPWSKKAFSQLPNLFGDQRGKALSGDDEAEAHEYRLRCKTLSTPHRLLHEDCLLIRLEAPRGV